MKLLQAVASHHQIDIFGETRIAVRQQSNGPNHDIIDSAFVEIISKTRERSVECSLTHKVAKPFGIDLRYRPLPLQVCRLGNHYLSPTVPGLGPKILSSESRKPGNRSCASR